MHGLPNLKISVCFREWYNQGSDRVFQVYYSRLIPSSDLIHMNYHRLCRPSVMVGCREGERVGTVEGEVTWSEQY